MTTPLRYLLLAFSLSAILGASACDGEDGACDEIADEADCNALEGCTWQENIAEGDTGAFYECVSA